MPHIADARLGHTFPDQRLLFLEPSHGDGWGGVSLSPLLPFQATADAGAVPLPCPVPFPVPRAGRGSGY